MNCYLIGALACISGAQMRADGVGSAKYSSGHHQAVLNYLIYMLDGRELSENSAVFRGGYTVEPKIIEKTLDDMCKPKFNIVKPVFNFEN